MRLSCTVFEILSLIFQTIKRSRDSDHAPCRDNLSSVGWDLLWSTCTSKLKSSLSRSRDILGDYKFKMGHVTWLRAFMWHFVICRLGIAVFHPHTKLEVSTINCNEDIKGNAKCKNSAFEPPFGGLRGNARGSFMARWKAHCRLTISDNWTFITSSEALLSEIHRNRRFLKGWVTLSANFR